MIAPIAMIATKTIIAIKDIGPTLAALAEQAEQQVRARPSGK